MAADIHSEYLFFKSKEVLLCIFSDIRHSDLKLFFLLLAHHIEQAHLTDHGIFLFLLHMVDDLNINTHELLSCSPQDIQCPGFDEIFHQPFIHQLPARNPGNKIFQISELSEFLSVIHNGTDHRAADTLDRSQSITDISAVY